MIDSLDKLIKRHVDKDFKTDISGSTKKHDRKQKDDGVKELSLKNTTEYSICYEYTFAITDVNKYYE